MNVVSSCGKADGSRSGGSGDFPDHGTSSPEVPAHYAPTASSHDGIRPATPGTVRQPWAVGKGISRKIPHSGGWADSTNAIIVIGCYQWLWNGERGLVSEHVHSRLACCNLLFLFLSSVFSAHSFVFMGQKIIRNIKTIHIVLSCTTQSHMREFIQVL